MNKTQRLRRLMPYCLLCCLVCSPLLNAQTITAWTEQNSTLGLGYPVPVPVDTPEPFNGFRTYAGLFAKHQMMAMNNPYITGHIVGKTHYNRDIWAYLLSDPDNTTVYGVKEGAMMVNGGIHAREWQTPETLTQIITDFNERSNDQSFYQFLLENTAIITIPSNNIDGFLQTQRYPNTNWYSNSIGPRDGRMRRKNMLNTDEILLTKADFLNGVDLNRNNNPYWASSTSSSYSPQSILYHGPTSQSEPETQARISAANLVDADQLRIYTDVHSFSQVHFANKSFNNQLNTLQSRVLADFTNHHKAFPAGKNYVDRSAFTTAGFGIGSTDEYFQVIYQVPSWTLEIEPSNNLNPDAHPDLPGFGADYGGFANNGHDGFILPDSEIKRVREQLAESFMVVWYGQAGPPSVTQMRIIDRGTNSIVFDAEWDINNAGERELYSHYFDEILAGQDYSLMLRFDKPMRYRNDAGEIQNLPGQSLALDPSIQALVVNNPINLNLQNHRWIDSKTPHWESFAHYKDDTFVVDFSVNPEFNDADEIALTWQITTTDMVGQNTDANPATVVTWANGQWQNYEDSNGNASINGGIDGTISVQISKQANNINTPVLPPTALYYDPARSGEGFSIEFINNEQAAWLQWFTFDDQGQQQWYVNNGSASATNALLANGIYTVEGGAFGGAFDPESTYFEVAGDLEIIFDQGQAITHPWLDYLRVGALKYTAPDGSKFRAQLQALTAASGFADFPINPTPPEGGFPEDLTAGNTGSWYNPERSGEGYHVQILDQNQATFQWYGFGLNGEKMWFIGDQGTVTPTATGASIHFDQVYYAEGGLFGSQFDPELISLTVWGEVTLTLNCLSGTISYSSELPGYGAGSQAIVPLTRPVGNLFNCSR